MERMGLFVARAAARLTNQPMRSMEIAIFARLISDNKEVNRPAWDYRQQELDSNTEGVAQVAANGIGKRMRRRYEGEPQRGFLQR